MINDRKSVSGRPRPETSWVARTRVTLITFLIIAFILLVYEHRVHLFTDNTLLVVLLLLCVGVHFFMHGGHGSGNNGRSSSDDKGEDDA